MNKTTFALIVGLLIFSAGGMQGRLGSLLAVFIDPASLQDISGTTGTTTTSSTAAAALAAATALADAYAKNNGGVRPQPTTPPGTLNQCAAGYLYNADLQMCVFAGTTGRHA